MLYQNEICPVCNKAFEEGDDIVTCPECGTPHHRDCYKALGKCANRELHSSGFVFKRKTPDVSSDNENAADVQKNPSPVLSDLLAKLNENEKAENQSVEQKAENAISDADKLKPEASFIFDKNERIEGALLSDIITAVGANFYKFIGKFKKNKLFNWNWSAFIFGPYYLIFRKMYGTGALLLSIRFAASIIVSVAYSAPLNAFANGVNELISSTQSITAAQYYKSLWSITVSSGAIDAFAIVIALTAVIHLFTALFSDRLYRKKIINLVSGVDEKLSQDASFTVNSFMGMTDESLSQSELKKLYLAGKGGVNFFAPACAMLIVSFLTELVSMI